MNKIIEWLELLIVKYRLKKERAAKPVDITAASLADLEQMLLNIINTGALRDRELQAAQTILIKIRGLRFMVADRIKKQKGKNNGK